MMYLRIIFILDSIHKNHSRDHLKTLEFKNVHNLKIKLKRFYFSSAAVKERLSDGAIIIVLLSI